jgi:hypothetical protein
MMTLFWIGTVVLYCIIVFLVHKLFYKEVRGDEQLNKKLWKIWGIKTAYWQGALLVALAIMAVLLLIAKWANILPKMN